MNGVSSHQKLNGWDFNCVCIIIRTFHGHLEYEISLLALKNYGHIINNAVCSRSQIVCISLGFSNGNWTECSTIQGVIAQVISKSDEREAVGRFEIISTITP